MFYYKENNGVIEKYAVDFDEKKITTLKYAIVENCSQIKHVEYKSAIIPRFEDKILIRNFQATKVGEKEYFEETKDVFQFSYDEYEPPYLVTLIDKLLDLKPEALSEIFNYDIFSELVNSNVESLITYYSQLIKLINLNFIDLISISDLKKVEDFLGVELLAKLNLDNSPSRILKKD